MTNNAFPCRICGKNAHGTHFGVITCRACGVFFRRSFKSKWIYKMCKKENEGKKCTCKPCRLQKCVEMGMSSKNFQHNRDEILTKHMTPSISYFVGRPEFLLFCDPSRSAPKILFNLDGLVSEASRLLQNGASTLVFAENQLKKLTLGLKVMQTDMGSLKYFGKIGKQEFLDIIEYYFMTVIKWISHFDEFRKLDQNIQMKLVQSVWHILMKFHKCSATVAYRKSSDEKTRQLQKVIRNVCLDREKVKMDLSWMSDYPAQHVLRCMFSHKSYDFKIIESLSKVDPTDVELTYMFAQSCFEYAGKRFQGEILKITDHFQQVLSNDLHHYYITEQRRERYSQRLTDIMKVNNLIQRSIWETRARRELGRVFNILKVEFSHPDMLEDSGFG